MKSRERKYVAHLVPEEVQPRVELADLALRPFRLAYLLNTNSTFQELLKLIKYNTSIWGGMANLLAPLVEEGVSTFWWNALCEFDPDIVLFTSDERDAVRENFVKELQPFSIKQWDSNAVEHHPIGLDKYRGVPMRFILTHMYEQVRPIEDSRIRIAHIDSSEEASLLSICSAAQFGLLEDDVEVFLRERLKAQAIELPIDSLHSYLGAIEAFRGMVHPLKLTRRGLKMQSGAFFGMFLGVVFVLMKEGSLVQDLSLFWNWRATARSISTAIVEIIALPFESVTSNEGALAVARWYSENIHGCNLITLASAGANHDGLARVRELLQPHLPDGTLVDIWWDAFQFQQFRLEHVPQSSEVRFEGTKVTILAPQPQWFEHVTSGMEWILDVNLGKRSLIGPGSGFNSPKFDDLNYLLAGEPDPRVWQYMEPRARVSHAAVSLRVNAGERYCSITLPDPQKLFLRLLESKGYTARVTDKSRYAQGMIRLMGDEKRIMQLQDRGLRHLLDKMANGRTALSLMHMHQRIRSSGLSTKLTKKDTLDKIALDFARRGVFLRGYWIKCPDCDLARWYGLDEFAEKMKCAGCLSTIQPPLQAEFHYRLNELFVRGIEQGSLSLLLTIRVLSSVATESFLYVPGIEVSRGDQKTDIDTLCICNGAVVIAESKSLNNVPSLNTVSEIIEQLRGTLEFGRAVKAEIVVLGTLLDEAPENLQEGLEILRLEFPSIAIHHFLKVDLERGYLSIATDGKEKRISLQDLLPERQVQTTGRDKSPGERKIGIGGGTWTQTIK